MGMQLTDQEEYNNRIRMLLNQFNTLFGKIEQYIKKQDKILRQTIPGKVKLEVTLSYFITLGFIISFFTS